jgi:serine/threonine protein kinase
VKYSRYLPPEIARTLFIQAAQALEFIHSIGLAHRDIKVENMLLTEDFILKLADFGFTENTNKYGDRLLRTNLGTKSYMSPQLI